MLHASQHRRSTPSNDMGKHDGLTKLKPALSRSAPVCLRLDGWWGYLSISGRCAFHTIFWFVQKTPQSSNFNNQNTNVLPSQDPPQHIFHATNIEKHKV